METYVEDVCKYQDDVIIIDSDDDISKPVLKKKTKIRKKNRKVSLDIINNNTETLIITQKLQVNRQKIKCVINLETNLIENIKEREITTPKVGNSIRRYVPVCNRTKCRRSVKDPFSLSNPKTRSDKEKVKKVIKQCKHSSTKKFNSHNQCVFQDKTLQKQCIEIDDMITTFSISSLSSNNMSYEDISEGSFSSDDTDLDTLIKRSKERDKLASQDSGYFHCSTPHNKEALSGTNTFDENHKTSNVDNNMGIFVYSSSSISSYISGVKLDFD